MAEPARFESPPASFESAPAQEMPATSEFAITPAEEPVVEAAAPPSAPATAAEPFPDPPGGLEPIPSFEPQSAALMGLPLEPPPPKQQEPSASDASSVSAASPQSNDLSTETLTEPLRPAPTPAPASRDAIERVRQYSEGLAPSRAATVAAYPFSLLITGHLAPDEKARLIDLVSRENMGIREMDLEPQFESGKILIPRISEYAGILIVSALRSAQAKFRFGPSDTIFATEDTADTQTSFDSGISQSGTQGDSGHPAEDLPVTTAEEIPGKVRHALVDVVTASAALRTLAVEAESSPEYQQLLEALSRELKYKAFHKGATAIVRFNVQLTPLRQPTHYRVLVTGAAVKATP